MYGITFRPFIKILSQETIDNYDFYIKIHVKNTKSPQNGCFSLYWNNSSNMEVYNKRLNPNPAYDPTDMTMQRISEFHKTIEIPLPKVLIGSPILLDSSVFISDMVCDKLHPSGNGITSNYINPLDNFGITIRNRKDPLKMMFKNAKTIGQEYIISLTTNPDSADDMYKKDASVFMTSSYMDFLPFVQYSKKEYSNYNKLCPNFRSGDSAYFSGSAPLSYSSSSFNDSQSTGMTKSDIAQLTSISEDSPYNNFVNNIFCINDHFLTYPEDTSTMIADRQVSLARSMALQIYNFLFGDDTEYELVCVNRNTGKVYTMNTPKPTM